MFELRGHIAGVGFASGDRMVVGHWTDTPLGPFCDVMWANSADERTLYAPTEVVAAFITSIYHFENVVLTPDLTVKVTKAAVDIRWDANSINLLLGRAVPFPPRSAWMQRWIEQPLARMLFGVHTHGTSPTGVPEVYKAAKLQRVRGGTADVAGHHLGTVGAARPACRFGFSEAPPFASLTHVTTAITDPDGRFAHLLER